MCTTSSRDNSAPDAVHAALPVVVQPSTGALLLSCAADSAASALPFSAFLLPAFEAPAAIASVLCDLVTPSYGIGHAAINVTVTPTLWPTFDDVIVVASK